MKNRKFIYLKNIFILGLLFVAAVSCEREISDEAKFASFPNTAEIFTDTPIGLGSNFYFPYLGSKLTAFSVDEQVSYKGSASIRIDVPNANDPEGSYAGAIFRIDGAGRNLTEYDALTFWAKSSQAATLAEVGFGEDFGANKYQTTRQNVSLTTNWVKYIIPIPDATKLVDERGMLRFAAGGIGVQGSEVGYSFWIDELKFEKLGTIAQPRPAILNGVAKVEQSFIGSFIPLTGLTQTFNIASGMNQTVTAAPSYFIFKSSNVEVARVSELGVVSIIGSGTAKITASLGNVAAAGSLTITSLGSFTAAPTPPARNASDVISIFSNAYTNQPVEYYNGYWAPYQTTLGQDDIHINGNDVIKYSLLNFVGIQFTKPTINVSQMTHFHVDVKVTNAIPSGGFLTIKLQDIGPDNTFGTADDAAGEIKYTSSTLVAGSWVSIDVPLSSFPGLTKKSNLAQVVFVTDATIKDILVDNIYFHK
jgi:hypothetical protein